MRERAQGSTAAAIQAYTGALALVAVSTLIGLWIAPRWGTAPVDMIYLPAVLAVAILWGLGPALAAGIAVDRIEVRQAAPSSSSSSARDDGGQQQSDRGFSSQQQQQGEQQRKQMVDRLWRKYAYGTDEVDLVA